MICARNVMVQQISAKLCARNVNVMVQQISAVLCCAKMLICCENDLC